MHKIELPISTATVTQEITGDIGGNSQTTIIEVKSNGGQFPLTEVEQTPSGFTLKIFGTWEASEFMYAMARMAKDHGEMESE